MFSGKIFLRLKKIPAIVTIQNNLSGNATSKRSYLTNLAMLNYKIHRLRMMLFHLNSLGGWERS